MFPILLIASTLFVDLGLAQRSQVRPSGANVEVFSLPFTPSQRRFSMSLEEESRLGDVIFRVVPSPESGIPSFTSLDIAPNSTGARYFTVSNATSGEIRLARLLDYEQAQTIDLDVRAWLAPPYPGSLVSSAPMAHALVGIQVVNINDNIPVFDAPHGHYTGELYAQIAENAPPGTYVTQLHATDVDPGDVGAIRYTIVGVTPGYPNAFVYAFGIDPVEGTIRVTNSTLLDREAYKTVDLLVAAVDNPSQSNRQYAAITRLTIELADENDNPPKFASSPVTAPSVCECASPGDLIIVVHADDPDDSSKNNITYRLISVNASYASFVPDLLKKTDPKTLFTVDPTTGRITVLPDVSLSGLIGNYSLLIEAADQDGFTARMIVNFNVTSDNKFPPEFTIPASAWTDGASIQEGLPAETRIIQINATDRDTFGLNDRIEFFLFDQAELSLVSNLSNGFRIDKRNGIVYSTRSFDAEVDPAFYDIIVVAQDRGTPTRQVNGTLMIQIVDKDEKPPRWRVGADGCNMQFHFYVPENSPIGSRIGRVWSVDEDRTNRSYYRLEARSDAKYFSINPTTGVITIANPDNAVVVPPGQQVAAPFLDYEDQNHRNFVTFVTVSAPNDGVPLTIQPTGAPQTAPTAVCLQGSTAQVNIHVTNMEDGVPIFNRPSKPYYFCVAGNAVKNTLVSRLPDLNATDTDGSRLTFRMLPSQWRAINGFVTVACAFRLQQPGVPNMVQTDKPSTAQLVVNSALGNYTGSYFRIPIDVRDQSGISASTNAFVWVTPPDNADSAATAHELTTVTATTTASDVVQPDPPSDTSTYYATITVAKKYEDLNATLSEWADCVSEKLMAGDRWFAKAPLCIASLRAVGDDPNSLLTEVRVAAVSVQDMLLSPAILFVASLQQKLNVTDNRRPDSICGVVAATCSDCGAGVVARQIGPETPVAMGQTGGFDPLALLIALAVILLFLILLLLLLLLCCCKAKKKSAILLPAPQALVREEKIGPAVPVFEVKPARLYETQEAYMHVDQSLAFQQVKGFEEQEVVLDEDEEIDMAAEGLDVDEEDDVEEEIFEIPLPREYETQTVLLDMPTWVANGEYGHANATFVLGHGEVDDDEPQPMPLAKSQALHYTSGSVYSEPYFRASHTEQRAFSMLHIDTRQVTTATTSRNQNQRPNREPPISPPPNRFMTMPTAALSPPNSSIAGRSSRGAVGTPSIPNLPGGASYIARRIGDNHISPLQQLPPEPQRRPSPPRPATANGLLRPAISADSITLDSQPQQARRAALRHQQRNSPPMRHRADESEPSDCEDPYHHRGRGRHHRMPDEDDEERIGNGRSRRARSLPKYLQPPVELQSVMAELHDYIKSPEQKARRRRISQKYRAKLLASGGAAALGNQTEATTSSSNESLPQYRQQPPPHYDNSRDEQEHQWQNNGHHGGMMF